MRKIINSAFVTLDGVTANPGSWSSGYFDQEAAQEAVNALRAHDGMLMGRGTYEYFADDMSKQTGPYPDAINAIRKYGFSSTLEHADWNNSTIIRSDVVAPVTELKQQDGGDLVIYGRGRLSQTLLEHDLVDELRLSVYPLLPGQRTAGSGNGQMLTLVASPRIRAASSHSPTSLPPDDQMRTTSTGAQNERSSSADPFVTTR